jgi:hypothetical protein
MSGRASTAYMRRPVTFDAMLQLWDEMAGWDLMAAALVEIVDEATSDRPEQSGHASGISATTGILRTT